VLGDAERLLEAGGVCACPFSKGSRGILAAVLCQVLKSRDLKGLLEKHGLQCLEPWGDVEPVPFGKRSNGWPCLSFPLWEVTQCQLCP